MYNNGNESPREIICLGLALNLIYLVLTLLEIVIFNLFLCLSNEMNIRLLFFVNFYFIKKRQSKTTNTNLASQYSENSHFNFNFC